MLKDFYNWTPMLPTRLVNWLATLGPCGYWTKAPGTIGSAIGIIAYTLLFYGASPGAAGFWMFVLLYLSIGICGEAEIRMQKQDPSEVILDEFVAIPFCFIGMDAIMASTPVWIWMLLGFGLFRFFDILKPFGIRRLQKLPGGLGVVMDDIAAALATCVVLHLFYRLVLA